MEEHNITENVSNNTPKKKRSRDKLIIGVLASVLVISILFLCSILLFFYTKYQSGKKMLQEKDYYGAIRIFSEFDNIEGTDELLNRAYYGIAEQHLSDKKYNEALRFYERANSYDDSEEKINTINSFLSGISLMENKSYEEAIDVFSSVVPFSDAKDRILECHYNIATELYSESKYLMAIYRFEKAEAYGDSKDQISECYYNLGVLSQIDKDYEKSIEYFRLAGNHIKSNKRILKSYYELGREYLEALDFEKAREYFEWADGYEDAAEVLETIDYHEGHYLFVSGKYEEAKLLFEKSSHLDEAKYPPHFRNLTEAEEHLRQKADELEYIIDIYVKDLPAEATSNYELMHIVYNYLPCQSIAVEYDENTCLLAIRPRYYPGHRILYAHNNNRTDILTDEEIQVYNKALALIEQAKSASNSETELELWLNNWICNNTVYKTPDMKTSYLSPEEQRMLNCIGVFIDGKANCQGYSDAFYLLGNLAGFKVRISGGMTTGPHAWNSIYLNNRWYMVDVTGNDINNFSSDAKHYIWFNSPLNTEFHTPSGGIDLYPWMMESTDYSMTYYNSHSLIFDNIYSATEYMAKSHIENGAKWSYVMIENSTASQKAVTNALEDAVANLSYSFERWSSFYFCIDGNIYYTVYWY